MITDELQNKKQFKTINLKWLQTDQINFHISVASSLGTIYNLFYLLVAIRKSNYFLKQLNRLN